MKNRGEGMERQFYLNHRRRNNGGQGEMEGTGRDNERLPANRQENDLERPIIFILRK